MPSSTPAQQRFARDLIPLLSWICGITVALLIRYGYYGSRSLVVGPNSSRMIHASSLFVEEVRIQGRDSKGELLIYGFSEPPELSLETNWSADLNHLSIQPYGHEGIFLWLNEGSRIWMKWEETYGSGSNENMYAVVTKGAQTLKESHGRSSPRPLARSVLHVVAGSSDGSSKEANYEIDEDGSYYIGIVNMNPRRMEAALKINVSSKAYDTKGATSECSTSTGNGFLCKLNLPFPSIIQYFVLKTDDDVPVETMNVQLSFVARLAAYFLVVGCVVLVVYLVLHQLGACESNATEDAATTEPETSETTALTKGMPFTYNTNEEDPTRSLCSSTDDMYEKICAICYDDLRSCFFTPCGHSVACRTCAKRIMEEENKVCPICRRLIHRVRRLVSAPKESWIQEKESTSKEPSVQEKEITS